MISPTTTPTTTAASAGDRAGAPPAFGELLRRHRVAAGLSRAQVMVASWTGHERLPDCAFRLASEFFDAPERPLNASCMDSVPPIRFVTGVVPSRWVSGLMARAASSPLPVAVATGVAAIALLTGLVGLSMRSARRASPADEVPGSRRAERVAGVAVAVGLVMLAGVAAAVYAAAAQNPLIPSLGVPAGWRWVLLLPWLSLAVWLAALALAVRQPRVIRSPSWCIGMSGLTLLLGIVVFATV